MDRSVDLTDLDTCLPAAAAARRVHVSKQLFYSWVKRGLIAPADKGTDGRPLYRIGDAMKVNAATLSSGCSSRAKTWPRQRALAAAAQLEQPW